jgi:hypothetical protein
VRRAPPLAARSLRQVQSVLETYFGCLDAMGEEFDRHKTQEMEKQPA